MTRQQSNCSNATRKSKEDLEEAPAVRMRPYQIDGQLRECETVDITRLIGEKYIAQLSPA
jgi:hypothetical protein